MNPEAIRQSIYELDQSIKRLMLTRDGLAAQLPRTEPGRKATMVKTLAEFGKGRNNPR